MGTWKFIIFFYLGICLKFFLIRLNYKIGGKNPSHCWLGRANTLSPGLSNTVAFQVYNDIQMTLASFRSEGSFFKKKPNSIRMTFCCFYGFAAGKARTTSTASCLRTRFHIDVSLTQGIVLNGCTQAIIFGIIGIYFVKAATSKGLQTQVFRKKLENSGEKSDFYYH